MVPVPVWLCTKVTGGFYFNTFFGCSFTAGNMKGEFSAVLK